jgi:microcystin-dependent protein
MYWDFAGINAQIGRAVAGDRTLSPATLVLCLSALSKMEFVELWRNAGAELTSVQWDVLEAQIANAYLELMTPVECSEGENEMEIGSIFVWPNSGFTIPENCLVCDGTEYLKSAYPDLYTALGSDWESDSTHFTVPDLRDRVVIGKGLSYGFQDTGGEIEHTLTIDEMPAHGHTAPSAVSAGIGNYFAKASTGTGTTGPTNETGGGESHNNMQPFMALVWVIVAE